MTACDILNQDGQRKGADSCLAIRHKDAMTDDEIIFAVEAFAFDVWDGEDWVETARGTTIGWKKLLRFPAVESSKVRVRLMRSRSGFSIFTPESFGLFFDPGR